MVNKNQIHKQISNEFDLFLLKSRQKMFVPLQKCLENNQVELFTMKTSWRRIISSIGFRNSEDGLSIKELSEYTQIDKGNLSRDVTELTKLNYLEKLFDKSDKRIIRVRLSPKGKNIYDTGNNESIRLQISYFDYCYSYEKLCLLADKLHEINEIIEQLSPDEYFNGYNAETRNKYTNITEEL